MARSKPPLHFLHIGKTGGAAIKHALQDHLTSGRYDISLHKHAVGLGDIPPGEKLFFCLRDPITRFVSGFCSRQRQGRPYRNSAWNADEEAAFRRFPTANQVAAALSVGDDMERNRAEHAMRTIRHVANSYVQWLVSESSLIARQQDILLIGFQETLDADFSELRTLAGLPDRVSLPRDDLHSHRNPPSCDTWLSDQARVNLQRWYADDQALLTFCKQLSMSLRS